MSLRRFTGDKLVLATHNKGKAAEIAALLSGHVQSFPTVSDLNLPEPDETENTFIGNAILKARAAAKAQPRSSRHCARGDLPKLRKPAFPRFES